MNSRIKKSGEEIGKNDSEELVIGRSGDIDEVGNKKQMGILANEFQKSERKERECELANGEEEWVPIGAEIGNKLPERGGIYLKERNDPEGKEEKISAVES